LLHPQINAPPDDTYHEYTAVFVVKDTYLIVDYVEKGRGFQRRRRKYGDDEKTIWLLWRKYDEDEKTIWVLRRKYGDDEKNFWLLRRKYGEDEKKIWLLRRKYGEDEKTI
jgi:hypothetical protein